MKKKALIFGGGQQGKCIAQDLVSANYTVVVIDKYPIDIPGIIVLDIQDTNSCNAIFDLFVSHCRPNSVVINALPSTFGHIPVEFIVNNNLKNILYIDLSFSKVDFRKYNEYFLNNGCAAIFDCGLAPGIPNLIVGHILRKQEKEFLNTVEIYVGGVSADRYAPLGYTITWSPEDLYEEYVRPARQKINNKIVEYNPLDNSCHQLVNIQDKQMEAFYSDGLRSLLDFPAETITEQTLRWPGHLDQIHTVIKQKGYNKRKFCKWIKSVTDNLADRVLLAIKVSDTDATYSVFLDVQSGNGMTAMAKTTALTCSCFAQILISGEEPLAGIYYPENLGLIYSQKIIDLLAKKDIKISIKKEA